MRAPVMYFFRHGLTDWNVEYRLQGQTDIPINRTGREQARANGAKLARLLGDAEVFDFVSSPLGRTRETMEIVRHEMGLDPVQYRTDDRLKELSFGDWEGKTLGELRIEHRELVDQRAVGKWEFVPPGGESYQMLAGRIAGWLADIERDSVISCHGGVLRALQHVVFDMPGSEVVELTIPQNRLFRLEGKAAEWI